MAQDQSETYEPLRNIMDPRYKRAEFVVPVLGLGLWDPGLFNAQSIATHHDFHITKYYCPVPLYCSMVKYCDFFSRLPTLVGTSVHAKVRKTM